MEMMSDENHKISNDVKKSIAKSRLEPRCIWRLTNFFSICAVPDCRACINHHSRIASLLKRDRLSSTASDATDINLTSDRADKSRKPQPVWRHVRNRMIGHVVQESS